MAEVDEVFMATQNAGWDCGASNGEGLSRVLATARYPGISTGAGTVWLDSNRPDFVSRTDPSSGLAGGSEIANGCSVLFLNYLNTQFGIDLGQIVRSGAPTLADTATRLIGDPYPFEPFALLLWLTFPPGTPAGPLPSDNPWPRTYPSQTLRGVVHLQDIGDVPLSQDKFMGTQGQSRRLEGFEIHFDPPIPDLSLRYQAAIQGRGTVAWVPEGTFIGTRGESRRLENFTIELTGSEAGNYTITYMAHAENTGDTPFVQNGAAAGVPGLRTEGLLVHVQHN
ncbi:hypothetical protein [Kitasatospora sp. NPDC094011]|uniref:hypothetical protein n=1 Tax=Kitasatospora sp. NPDC094011 TaxID=3364090 RepID=UPI00380E80FE